MFTDIPHNTHKAVVLLQFLGCNDKEGKVQCHMLLNPRLVLSLWSGWYRNLRWVVLLIDSELLYYIRQKRFKQISVHFANHKTNKFQCTDKLHFAEHLQSVPGVLRIPSIWILDAFTWCFLTCYFRRNY